MNLPVTLGLLAAFAIATALFGWAGARPPDPRRVRMAPYRFLMLLTAAGVLMMLVHAVNLLGFHTGR